MSSTQREPKEVVIRSTCNSCFARCTVLNYVKDGKLVRIEGDPSNPMTKGKICIKGLNAHEWVHHPDRIKFPLKRAGARGEGKWQRISWDQAYELIANRLEEIIIKYGPEAIAASVQWPGRYPLSILLWRSLGSPNVYATEDLCEGPAIIADKVTVGTSVTQVPTTGGPESLDLANCICIWGSNPQASHPANWAAIAERLKAADRPKLIVVDPRHTEAASRADIWLQIRPGTDSALALAWLNVIINEKLYDEEFVDRWCIGFEKLRERVQEYPPDKVADICWIAPEDIKEAARTFATIKNACLYTRRGCLQRLNATQTARAHTIILAITGNLDVPGGNLLPKSCAGFVYYLDFMMGEEWQLPREIMEKQLGAKEFPLLAGPDSYFRMAHNSSVKRAILYGEPYYIRALILEHNNEVSSSPDSRAVWEALKKVDFFVAIDMFSAPYVELADIVLPAAGWLEREEVSPHPETVGHKAFVSYRSKVVEPVGESKEDRVIVLELAERLRARGLLRYDFLSKFQTVHDYDEYKLAKTGKSVEDLKRSFYVFFPIEGFKQYEKRGFATPSGKVELYSSIFEKYGYDPLPHHEEPIESPVRTPHLAKAYPLILISARSLFFYHSEGRQLPWTRRVMPYPEVEIHLDTAKERGISDGDWVWIKRPGRRIKQKAKVTNRIHPSVVCASEGWWFPENPGPEHGCFECALNVLTSNEPPFDPIIGSPSLKPLLCDISKVNETVTPSVSRG